MPVTQLFLVCSVDEREQIGIDGVRLGGGIPCGKPGYTLSVAPFTSFADCKAAAPMGTI